MTDQSAHPPTLTIPPSHRQLTFLLTGSLAGFSQSALGRAVDQLEFDGSRTVNGIEYFVYSAVGSAIGLDALGG